MREDLYEIYGMWHKPFWQTTSFYVVMGLVVFFLLLVVFVRCFGFRKKQEEPWECALRDLDDLGKNVSESKEFYFALTSILKTYMHARYGFNLCGKTDDEVIAYLANTNFSHDLLEKVRAVFGGCMVVKFANERAVRDQMACDLAMATTIVKKTVTK